LTTLHTKVIIPPSRQGLYIGSKNYTKLLKSRRDEIKWTMAYGIDQCV